MHKKIKYHRLNYKTNHFTAPKKIQKITNKKTRNPEYRAAGRRDCQTARRCEGAWARPAVGDNADETVTSLGKLHKLLKLQKLD